MGTDVVAGPPLASALISLRAVSKTFAGVTVLRDVDLDVKRGEVHGLLGHNGSGKSTLIKVLSGFHAPDPGARITVLGEEHQFPLSTHGADGLALGFVHQDLGLIPSLTVTENFNVGKYARRGQFKLSRRREHQAVAELFSSYGVKLDPRQPVSSFDGTERALVAILRAFDDLRESDGRLGQVLVLDEPTPFLPVSEIAVLFELVQNIASQGAGIIFITHDIEEALAHTDRLTVLRDGRVVGTGPSSTYTAEDLVHLIVGSALSKATPLTTPPVTTGTVATLREISGNVLRGLSMDLREGEIVGLAGLLGSGYEELPYLLFGVGDGRGELLIDGQKFDVARLEPRDAISAGLALIPADRADAGSVGSLTVMDNVTVTRLSTFQRKGLLRRAEMTQSCAALGTEFDVRPNMPSMEYGQLSGGNQQKALLGKWLATPPRLLMLHEPTQGVDVGARKQLLSIIRNVAGTGAAVLCASSDYAQLAELCDRVLIITRGKVTAELSGSEVTKQQITAACLAPTTPSIYELEYRAEA